MRSRVTELLGIQYPIIQGGMIWNSGWRLASAVSNGGGLGLIGGGSMKPEVLRQHIRSCRIATDKPFGVNLPILHYDIKNLATVVAEEGVSIVFTSAGNPKTLTPLFKQAGMKVVHVVSSSVFAKKAQDAGCDAVVAEGFEAGGHNGIEETSTMVLIPAVVDAVTIPVIAAGGICDGRSMAAAWMLGAEGVQMGSRFVASIESSGHNNFKQQVVNSKEGETSLCLKKITPVRMLKNDFYREISLLEASGADRTQLEQLLGRGRSKKGMFEGDMSQGELEIGQVSSRIKDVLPAAEIVRQTMEEFRQVMQARSIL